MANQSTTPHIRDSFSPLQDIVTRVLRRFGDFSVSAVDGDTLTMFVDLANLALEEINSHPYWNADPLDYYTHPSEVRPVPDLIMQNALLFQYALQQASPKIELYSKVHYQTLNTLLWRRLNNGVGNQPLRARVVDGGSNKHYSPATSPLTGQDINADE
ncbi:hypothetical protein [Endozoicomonas atrinae]|uniref:hypothetical protein n=1 Tax=Endozoicomonas atrinae TaxID=1333660 RepID=UPI00082623B6|nr:hypothetical protein [Endozoicomonas atrinae]